MKPLSPAAMAQISAADPAANTWLTANAGSGKTRVLTDRVARLLLSDVSPQNILCLTYTKAAAAEMQNRLFKRLGAWAMAADEDLRRNLAELGESGDLPEAKLRMARRLFARAIETPGGIRIQTIHSFCAALLRRFPLEAGVSPAFVELDDRTAMALRNDILEDMAAGPDAEVLRAILPHTGEDLDHLLQQIVGNRAELAAPPSPDVVWASLGLTPGFDEAQLLQQVFLGGEEALLADLLPVLAAGSTNDTKAHAKLAVLQPLGRSLRDLSVLEDVLLSKENKKTPELSFAAKIGSFPTKDSTAKLADVMPALHALMGRVEAARGQRLALETARRTLALHRFSAAFLARYEAAKEARAWLDFDDLIVKATGLLTDRSLSAWVLYRLDGGIDHVLVDEAQDTSPAQWRIIAALTAEFTAGLGARDVPRTLFVVGDKKQSIYSFQGADVAAFDSMRRAFGDRLAATGVGLAERPLVHSFRSSRAILSLVDHTFHGELQSALGGQFGHEAFHERLPGRIDLWPPVKKPEKPEPNAWYDPVDMVGEDDASVVLARQIAAEIKAMIAAGVQIPDDPAEGTVRPVHEGDFLILVQRRAQLFNEIIRACKAEGLAIAGADRLKLRQELAVRDVLALLSFLNTPEDDLALATALRSPLFGWSEAQLYRLAHGRPGYLWERLRNDPEAAGTRAVLDDLRGQTEFLRPFELIDRILTRHEGRRLLLGRLGDEAADAIDELLAQALAYERMDVPSLTGFLVRMETGDVEVKRQAESEGHRIRVMTVHGAKGLEAPIVILPDTADRQDRERDKLLDLDERTVVWAGRKETIPPAMAATLARRADLRAAENLRLLYVAMTRAKCWLIVAAAGETSETSWYGRVQAGLQNMAVTPGPNGRLRHQGGEWPENHRVKDEIAHKTPLPDWARHPAPAPEPALPTLSPSQLGGAKSLAREQALDAEGEEAAKARGVILHLLLEHLPGRDRPQQAEIARRIGAGDDLLAEAQAILSDSGLGWIFGPGSAAEVPFVAQWQGRTLTGAIDRLVVLPDRVVVVDFKSNATLPNAMDEVPEGYLRQLGAYALAMEQVYRGLRIETAILWTRGPQLMPINPDIVRDALLRSTIP